MALLSATPKIEFPFGAGGFVSSADDRNRQEALVAELAASQARERRLSRQVDELSRRDALLTDELSHRLFNGLQLIGTLLSAQGRLAPTETATQLVIAIGRIVAFGQVHRRLHLLDHQAHVEFRRYLFDLCEELSDLLFGEKFGFGIVVEGSDMELPTALAIPLGFIVNEMITNSAKFAGGKISVRLDPHPLAGCSLSVTDEGPGLPAGFDPNECEGLGMKIILSLARRIGGKLVISAGDHDRGCCFAVTFSPVVAASDDVMPPFPEATPSFDPSRPQQRGASPLFRQALDSYVAQTNIELFGALLQAESDVTGRAMIADLVATEVATAPKINSGSARRIILASRSK